MIKQGEKYKAMCSAKKQAFGAGKEKKKQKNRKQRMAKKQELLNTQQDKYIDTKKWKEKRTS